MRCACALPLLIAALSACGDDASPPDLDGDTESTTSTSTDTATTSTTTDTTTSSGTSTTTDTPTSGGSTGGSTGGQTPSGPFGSGSRLRAVYLDGGGGAVALREFQDTELDMRCTFRQTAPGEYHCIPTRGGGFRFQDAGCTMPVITAAGYETGEYIGRSFQRTCDDPMASAWIAGETTTFAQTYIITGNGTCSESVADASGRPLTAVSDAELVAATASVVGGSELQAIMLEGDDGSFHAWALADAEGRPCEQMSVQDSLRCVPTPTPGIGGMYYGDDACSEQTVASLPFGGTAVCPTADPLYARDSDATGCGVTFDLFEIGDPLADTEVYLSAGACDLVSNASVFFQGGLFWSFGAPVPASDFAAPLKDPIGRGDVTVDYVILDSDDLMQHTPNVEQWRLAGNDPCVPTRTNEDTWRCIPDPSIVIDPAPLLFADAGCMQGVASQSTACANLPQAHFREQDASGVVTALYEAVEFTGQLYQDADGCIPTEGSATSTYFTVGDPLPLSTFPELVEMQE